MNLRFHPARLAGLLLLVLPHGAQGEVHIVDKTDAPGTDFLDVETAVAAAQDGDVLLVRGGGYAGPEIVGKSLTIGTERGFGGVLHNTVVRDLAPGQTVVFQEIELRGSRIGLQVLDCQGSVLVQDCPVEARSQEDTIGAEVLRSSAVTFVDCRIYGRNTNYATPLRTVDSSVNLYRSTVEGTEGYFPFGAYPAVEASNSNLFLVGSAVTGGPGTDGSDAGIPFPYCLDGTPGGHGIVADAGTSVTWIDSTFVGGAGGAAGAPGEFPCVDGADGEGIQPNGAFLDEFEGVTERAFEMPGLLSDGEEALAVFEGQPGEAVLVLYAPTARTVFAPLARGVLIPDPATYRYRLAGFTSAEGRLELSVRLAHSGLAGFDRYYVQSWHASSAGAGVLGTPRVVTVLP